MSFSKKQIRSSRFLMELRNRNFKYKNDEFIPRYYHEPRINLISKLFGLLGMNSKKVF